MRRAADKYFAVAVAVYYAFDFAKIAEDGFPSWTVTVSHLLKPLIVLGLVFRASTAIQSRFNKITLLGIVSSFLGAVLLIPLTKSSGLFPSLSATSAAGFYILFCLHALRDIGKNFGIFPAKRALVSVGAFSVVRHPIYSSYMHASTLVFLLAPSVRNFAACGLVIFGLWLRAIEEERVLASSEYQTLKSRVPMFFSISLFLPMFPVLFATFWERQHTNLVERSSISVTFAYPAFGLSPLSYDDWGSVFIGNHIYRHLLTPQRAKWVPSIARSLSVTCEDESLRTYDSNCKRMKVSFTLVPFSSCDGTKFGFDDIRNEFLRILKAKPWILPHASECHHHADDKMCVVFDRIGDAMDRLHNLYFRFGWSKTRINSKSIGSGAYCLRQVNARGDQVMSGNLEPNDAENLPKMNFLTTQDPKVDFDVALYGTKDLITSDKRINLRVHTPLAYYLVSHPKWANVAVPWDSERVIQVIRSHFIQQGLIFDRPPPVLQRIVPDGLVQTNNLRPFPKAKLAFLALPEYIPYCNELAYRLNSDWKDLRNVRAECVNTTELVDQEVRSRRGNYDAFVTPLSPGAPDKNGIRDQYFSPDSPDSFTGSYPYPKRLYRVVGIGQSLITVRSRRICNIGPTSLGLGNVLISDFEQCSN